MVTSDEIRGQTDITDQGKATAAQATLDKQDEQRKYSNGQFQQKGKGRI